MRPTIQLSRHSSCHETPVGAAPCVPIQTNNSAFRHKPPVTADRCSMSAFKLTTAHANPLCRGEAMCPPQKTSPCKILRGPPTWGGHAGPPLQTTPAPNALPLHGELGSLRQENATEKQTFLKPQGSPWLHVAIRCRFWYEILLAQNRRPRAWQDRLIKRNDQASSNGLVGT